MNREDIAPIPKHEEKILEKIRRVFESFYVSIRNWR